MCDNKVLDRKHRARQLVIARGASTASTASTEHDHAHRNIMRFTADWCYT